MLDIIKGMLNVQRANLAHSTGLVGAHDVQDILCLVLEEVPPLEAISSWTQEQKDLAYKWAAREHLVASDNGDLPRLKKPDFLSDYQ